MIIGLAALLLSAARGEELRRFEAVEQHMGTLVSMRVYAANSVLAQRALEKAFTRVRDLDNLLSDYKPDSEVSRLAAGKAAPASADLLAVLRLAGEVWKETEGAFDVSIGAVTHLWRASRAAGRLPDDEELRAALGRSGYQHVRVNAGKRTVLLGKDGMKLDLGGIAKGYAADAALDVLRASGVRRALVAVSGDLAIGDPPPGREGWQVEIAGGRVLELKNCGVSTSGDEEQHWEIGGKRYSHIVDARTGKPLEASREVTVVTERSAISDALATAICVTGITYESAFTRRHRTRVYLVP
ncbi:MAG: FAD:protein FMN transferase [Acidobacteria bacterium]|nr:FAD:protein FMN transferase [Acidobacteriota bacterium]